MDLKNSTILITGGTSGIGLELVKQLGEKGATIIVTGRKMEALEQTKKRFPKVHTFQSDVSDPGEIRKLYQNVVGQFPELNILINNAVEMRLIDMHDTFYSLKNLIREININLSGIIQMAHQFLPHLIQKPAVAIYLCLLNLRDKYGQNTPNRVHN